MVDGALEHMYTIYIHQNHEDQYIQVKTVKILRTFGNPFVFFSYVITVFLALAHNSKKSRLRLLHLIIQRLGGQWWSEVIVTIVSKLVYFTYLRDVFTTYLG